jgi:hypothetical protein
VSPGDDMRLKETIQLNAQVLLLLPILLHY